MQKQYSGNEIRKTFIKYFEERGHTLVPSSSLVPGGDQTLLFTNAGMVQFKDVFLGLDNRPYTRAVNSQKCMRVAGKHNDLEDVGRDDTHHTFFEMLGNWSFGDYYKKEAISWAWELLTDVWELDKNRLWVTCFKDEKNEIPTDEEALATWKEQPGLDRSHILMSGRKTNFWEMADVGPCGPCSEIHYDRGAKYCNKQNDPHHVCGVNSDCTRYLELWNLVFIQYNRVTPSELVPLPKKHVDTGMGFERIVSVLQDVDSNYKTDVLLPLMDVVLELNGASEDEREKNITPYRVIADHVRAATFLISDGVVPGNIGRNYICRMIIRRAARFGTKIDLHEPFMAPVAEEVIKIYGEAYPELLKNKKTILDNLTREEKRFIKTLETGLAYLVEIMEKSKSGKLISGEDAFVLYATHGLPLEITRDIAGEEGFSVDESGYQKAMEQHRVESGAGKEFGPLGGEDAEKYAAFFEDLYDAGSLDEKGVVYDPYDWTINDQVILALIAGDDLVDAVQLGQDVEVVIPKTNFYLQSGGQVSDNGLISADDGSWEIQIEDVRKPTTGLIVHVGKVTKGNPKVGDRAHISIDMKRRQDIMRNHTATHLLHAGLRKILGTHVRQAGSLVAPDRLRFDFTHPDPLTNDELQAVQDFVNNAVLNNEPLQTNERNLQDAINEGAMALFGEKYGEKVRTVVIGDKDVTSYELCGGTHVDETGEIGSFIIISEGSTAAGIRRIEAVTGREAQVLINKRFTQLQSIAEKLQSGMDQVESKLDTLLEKEQTLEKENQEGQRKFAMFQYNEALQNTEMKQDSKIMTLNLGRTEITIARELTDRFRNENTSGSAVFAGINEKNEPYFIATVTEDLIDKGIKAGDVVNAAAALVGGKGGGRLDLAQAGGKDPAKIDEALQTARNFIEEKLK
ncbi:MAG: Alanine--tRNA ligase [Anaerolinea thermophila]|uniref:Alanine--tRNA ligase n=1 Tax=Anaerolinea thermophila TaxID=167964 RepID=A0A101FYL1_9CHLR|nr:MAG: Alanine--tRNA ligase [Anaerolinea thermophila]